MPHPLGVPATPRGHARARRCYGSPVHASGSRDDTSGTASGSNPATEQLADIRTEQLHRAGHEVLLVTVTGEIDMHTVGRFRAAVDDGLERVADTDAVALIVDLTGVTFFGSPGLNTLAEATRTARRLREPLRIVVDHTRPVVRPIQMTGLDHLLSLYTTVEEALDRSEPYR